MNTFEIVDRFDAKDSGVKPSPPDAAAALRTLDDGSRKSSRWRESRRAGDVSPGEARAADGIREVRRPDARARPGYRESPTETAVCVTAAQAAYDHRWPGS